MIPSSNAKLEPSRWELTLRVILAVLLAVITIAIVVSWEKTSGGVGQEAPTKTVPHIGTF